MGAPRGQHLPAWAVPLLPAAIAAVIVAAFLLGGPVAGFAAALVAAGLVVVAAIRMKPGRGPRASGEPDRRVVRDAALRFTAPVLLAAVGIVMTIATDGTAEAIGWGLIAIAITVAISLVFLEVGYSEDRARERAGRSRGRPRSSG